MAYHYERPKHGHISLSKFKVKRRKTKQCHSNLKKTLTFLSHWHAIKTQIATGSRDLPSDIGRMKVALADDSLVWNIWPQIVPFIHVWTLALKCISNLYPKWHSFWTFESHSRLETLISLSWMSEIAVSVVITSGLLIAKNLARSRGKRESYLGNENTWPTKTHDCTILA